ncbi:MAG TPA: hypothetical protein VH278_17530 [Burkholderiaceae bacterium]|nr:hypothetical protein [Burkholderiaceae bacterium]
MRLIAIVCLAAVIGPVRADQWSVEKAGFNLYRITGQRIQGQSVFIRTDGCDDAPDKGDVNVQKEGGARRLTFNGSSASCTVRDFLVPVEVEGDRYSVRLTRDQGSNWYRVTDGDLYLKTAACISRSISEVAMLDLKRDGTGWAYFADGRKCLVEHAFRRFTP